MPLFSLLLLLAGMTVASSATVSATAPTAAVVPLTAAQQQQLASTVDGPGFDQAGLYALLANVSHWSGESNAPAAALDFRALLEHPAAQRGRLFHLTGIYAGQQRRVPLSRPGPWGRALTRWGIITNRARDRVVIVFFVDPQARLVALRPGRRVAVTARFYMRWDTVNLKQQPARFLIFIARQPQVVETGSRGTGAAAWLFAALAVLAAALALLIRQVRRVGGRMSTEARRPGGDSASAGDAVTLVGSKDVEPSGEGSLPRNPADALDVLARCHKPDEQDNDAHR